jgi:hypothetical protein
MTHAVAAKVPEHGALNDMVNDGDTRRAPSLLPKSAVVISRHGQQSHEIPVAVGGATTRLRDCVIA